VCAPSAFELASAMLAKFWDAAAYLRDEHHVPHTVAEAF
jgi:hypothetical protein